MIRSELSSRQRDRCLRLGFVGRRPPDPCPMLSAHRGLAAASETKSTQRVLLGGPPRHCCPLHSYALTLRTKNKKASRTRDRRQTNVTKSHGPMVSATKKPNTKAAVVKAVLL